MSSFDERFSQALRDAAELAPDTSGESLADSAERIGRSRAVRRRTVVVSGAAVLALAALTTTVELRSGPGRPTVAAGTGTTGTAQVTGQFMADTLASLLPSGGRTSEAHGTGTGDPNSPGPMANLLYTDATGAARLELSASRVQGPVNRWTYGTQCPDPFDTALDGCTRSVRADGSIVVVEQLSGPPRTWSAYFTRTDGQQLRLDEADFTGGSPADGKNLPISPDQLAAVLSSSAWNPVLSAVTVPASAPPQAQDTAQAPAPEDVLAGVQKRLPADARADAGDLGKQNTLGSAHLAVTLSGRTSQLQITVEPKWAQGDGPEAQSRRRQFTSGASDPGDVTRAADGTSVISQANNTGDTNATGYGAPGQVSWVVDALHPDGTRVTVTEWNGPSSHAFTAGPLALNADQLTAIALGTDWAKP
ncbi:hypothetical protein LN042_23435 [Kitasatospora sp. RB6PN24]|uniref:hypothetical protein n=1 Tax=Kitasatospora humi TaxID=2893891 RepID=UPI001E346C93|nr:hypothetical protein [Kitasatospora humi]MCC9309991.1 hypothetical protein [Kitasatospora humi]